MSNTILELRTLDDDELMGIVGGGGQNQCQPRPECQPCGGVEIKIDVCLSLCLL